jgi:predicted secreted acid phosphatase
VDEDNKELRFTEMLKESGSGMSSGDSGFGFKKESYKTGTGPREGTTEEQSKLFGAQYSYTFDFSTVRTFIEEAAVKAGYAFKYHLNP